MKLKDPDRSESIVQEYGTKPGVRKVDDQKKFLDRVFNAFNGVRNMAFGAALIMAIAALLLIANTIQVSAFTRRTEVGIMRLVGATRWYTQLPFLLEAVVAGAVGAILGIIMLVLTKVQLPRRGVHRRRVPEDHHAGAAVPGRADPAGRVRGASPPSPVTSRCACTSGTGFNLLLVAADIT